MKKIVFAIVLVLTIGLSASAQSDGFFRGGSDYSGGRESAAGTLPMLPGGTVGQYGADQPATAPIGSGLIILTALGAGYAMAKKRKN